MFSSLLFAILMGFKSTFQHYIPPPNPCLLAQMCNHTWIKACGGQDTMHKRTFLDLCDMHEYNCDNKADYKALDIDECPQDTTIPEPMTKQSASVDTESNTVTLSTIETINAETTESTVKTETSPASTEADTTTTASSVLSTFSSSEMTMNQTNTLLTTTPADQAPVNGSTALSSESTSDVSSTNSTSLASSTTISITPLAHDCSRSTKDTTKQTSIVSKPETTTAKTETNSEITKANTLTTVTSELTTFSTSSKISDMTTTLVPSTSKENATINSNTKSFISTTHVTTTQSSSLIPSTTISTTTLKYECSRDITSTIQKFPQDELKPTEITTQGVEQITVTSIETSETNTKTAVNYVDTTKAINEDNFAESTKTTVYYVDSNETTNGDSIIEKATEMKKHTNMEDPLETFVTIEEYKEEGEPNVDLMKTTNNLVTCSEYPKDCDIPYTWETTVKGETRDFYKILRDKFGENFKILKATTHWPRRMLMLMNDGREFFNGRHGDIRK